MDLAYKDTEYHQLLFCGWKELLSCHSEQMTQACLKRSWMGVMVFGASSGVMSIPANNRSNQVIFVSSCHVIFVQEFMPMTRASLQLDVGQKPLSLKAGNQVRTAQTLRRQRSRYDLNARVDTRQSLCLSQSFPR